MPEIEELMTTELWAALPAVKAGKVVEVRHHSASTFETAIAALDSIDEQLTALSEA